MRSSYFSWCGRLIAQIFDVSNDLKQFLLADVSLVNGHHFRITRRNLGLQQDAIADVHLIRGDNPSIRQWHRFSEQTFQPRSVNDGVAHVTTAAAQFAK